MGPACGLKVVVRENDHRLMLAADAHGVQRRARHRDRRRGDCRAGGAAARRSHRPRTSCCSTCACRAWTASAASSCSASATPPVKAIIFSGSDDPAAADAAFARGAVAFIQKTIDPADLPAVVRQAVAGNVIYAAGHNNHTDPAEAQWHLTAREIEILRALAAGQSNKQIAKEFWLSEQTIKYHLTNIYRKLQGHAAAPKPCAWPTSTGVIENPVLRTAALTA